MATPTLLGHPQRATPRFEGLASRGDRSRVAGEASAEGEFEPRVWRGRRGNAMIDSTPCLQRSFKGKGPRAQRRTHRLEAGELRSATRASRGARSTAGVDQSRDGVAQSGEARWLRVALFCDVAAHCVRLGHSAPAVVYTHTPTPTHPHHPPRPCLCPWSPPLLL